MPHCAACDNTASFRLDAYDTSNFPAHGRNLACGGHLSSLVVELEQQLAWLDDSDALCVSVLDESLVE